MDVILGLAKWVVATGAIAGGILGVGKVKFVTKKEFERKRDVCQLHVFSKLDEMHAQQVNDMREIKEFMGKVNYHISRVNGGK